MSTPTQQIDAPRSDGLRRPRPALPAAEIAAALRAAATGPELVAALDAAVEATDLTTASAAELAGLWVAAVRTALWADHLQGTVRAEVDARMRSRRHDSRSDEVRWEDLVDDAEDDLVDGAEDDRDDDTADDLPDGAWAQLCECCR
ncbi:hypothetical protein [Cellulomonas sp. NPDC058312]|uniref:hypothetical protein n=1 Tax=Cellulomonas sp. NPDC058312 TaxID=3346441 RepID=UPI0036E21C33